MATPTTTSAPRTAIALERRVRGEFREMPGMQLTRPQAARLFGMDAAACAALLEALVAEGFLSRGERGAYVLTSRP